MFYGFLISLFVILCIILILTILIQKSKGSIGIGNLGGSSQMIFGGSGGQDFFQKTTWVLGILFMAGSLVLALMKSSSIRTSRYLSKAAPVQVAPAQQPVAEPQAPVAEPVAPAQEQPATPAAAQ
ncbi:MAG: preprotein translocase subunit SecG [Candidatus Babeliaceae bacterium]|jgi:preprotein translocase subunit SecG